MDVTNDLYKHQTLVLPREYEYLSGELPGTDHTCILEYTESSACMCAGGFDMDVMSDLYSHQ